MKAPRMMVPAGFDRGGSSRLRQMLEAIAMKMIMTVSVSGMIAPSTIPAI